MSIYFLEKRRQIEGLYRKLELIREEIRNLAFTNSEYSTRDNIGFLELEEEAIISKILKLKSI